MTLQNLKVDLVENKKVFNEKQFNKFIFNTGLFVSLGTFTLAFIIGHIVNIMITLSVIILGVVCFVLLTQYCTEEVDNAHKVAKFTKFWFLWIPILVGGIVALKFLNFM